MIDLHSHILYGIDDSCTNIDETLIMIRDASLVGISKIFATPHFVKDRFENYKSDVVGYVDNLNLLLSSSGINVTVAYGNEIMVCPDIVDLLKNDKLCTLNNSRYILIEFPMNIRIPNIHNVINDIIVAGFIPIIAHPERYVYVQRNIDEAIKYVESGALLQLNVNSVIGGYGENVRVCAIKLLKHNLIHLWGSDSHNYRTVYDSKLEVSFAAIEKIVGADKFKVIKDINPNCVWDNKEIKIFDIKYKLGLFN